jgi:hypothetical protein
MFSSFLDLIKVNSNHFSKVIFTQDISFLAQNLHQKVKSLLAISL